MRVSKFLRISLLILFATSACHKSPTPNPQPTPPVQPTGAVDPDVYVAGEVSAAGATYWKNGIATNLVPGTSISAATGIVVQGSDVYVCGYIVEGNPNGIQTAVYWKNGVMVRLATGFANGIIVQGTDVYVVGTSITGTSSNSKSQAAYWKNGVINLLNAVNPFTQAPAVYSTGNAMVVNGSDIYVAGTTRLDNNGVLTASLWKNGNNAVFQTAYSATAPLASAQSLANCLAIQGTDVYVGGYIAMAATGVAAVPNAPQGAVYWKNGTAVQLADGTFSSKINGIFLQGTDIYTCGIKNDYPTSSGITNVGVYWKNATPVILPPTTGGQATGMIPYAIILYNNDIYVAGTVLTFISSTANPPGSTITTPAYWKNGVAVALPAPYISGIAYAITVVPHQ